MDSKGIAIVSHITLIGWVIALVLNSQEKDEFASFYIRQMLGLMIMSIVSWIPVIGWIVGLVIFILWIISLVNAIQGVQKPLPVIGEYFQEWFKFL